MLRRIAVRSFSSAKPPAHPKDRVYRTVEEKRVIKEAAHHIPEESLEHDQLGSKQHHHHEISWKEAEDIQQHEKDAEKLGIPSGSKPKK